MDPKYTPKPWTVTPILHSQWHFRIESPTAIVGETCLSYGMKSDTEVPEANARLMAASPDLAEALLAMIQHYAPGALREDSCFLTGGSRTDAVLLDAVVALRKAGLL